MAQRLDEMTEEEVRVYLQRVYGVILRPAETAEEGEARRLARIYGLSAEHVKTFLESIKTGGNGNG